jgi:hypothetical protein
MSSQASAASSVEYIEAVATYRFYHEYRMRILQTALTLNGVFFLVVTTYLEESTPLLISSIFAGVASTALLMLEVRTVAFANNVWSSIRDIESALAFSTFSKLHEFAAKSGPPQRFWIRIVYYVIILTWVYLITSIAINHEIK